MADRVEGEMANSLNVSPPKDLGGEHPTSRAVTAWDRARRSCESFLRIFDQATANRGSGAPKDEEQDLLRAMLVFACAGLDASVSHLVRDCASDMLARSPRLREETESFAQDQLGLSREGTGFLLRMLSDSEPGIHERLVEEFMHRRTEQSLQSHEELLRICSYFEIDEKALRDQILALRDVFRARNAIIHEMDVNFLATNRRRTSRRRDDMVTYTERTLTVAAELIRQTQQKLDD